MTTAKRTCGGTGTFPVPWDSYGAGTVTAPVNMNKNYGFKGAISTQLTVPTVPLNLTTVSISGSSAGTGTVKVLAPAVSRTTVFSRAGSWHGGFAFYSHGV